MAKPSDADGGQHSRAGQCEIKRNLIKLLQEKCGEEMKSGKNSGNAGPAPAGHNEGGATWTKIRENSRKGPQK
jgi:hypothetical protein